MLNFVDLSMRNIFYLLYAINLFMQRPYLIKTIDFFLLFVSQLMPWVAIYRFSTRKLNLATKTYHFEYNCFF